MNKPDSPPSSSSQPQNVVHVARPIDPAMPDMSPETRQKHEESKQRYPYLNLSMGEYIIDEVKRHPVALMRIWLFSGLIAALALTLAIWLLGNDGAGEAMRLLSVPLLFMAFFAGVAGAIGTFVFNENRFYLTNESVIQYIRTGLFHKKIQTVSLGNIEDASFNQSGIGAHIFNYGMIRLSTEGDETTYRFQYASRPEQQINRLNNAVEAFKHGRPVEG